MTADIPEYHKRLARRLECEQDGLYFTRYFMRQRLGARMLLGRHHPVIANVLQRVIQGDIRRLIINVPPGYTKTEMACIAFMARGLAINVKARFMHLSYSDGLALLNSSLARRIVMSPAYQDMWPRRLLDDTNSKKLWWTEQGGGVYATSTLGQVTGFRAGHMDPEFSGALLLDDPIKPGDVLSKTIRGQVNDNYVETISTRLATEDIPVILIMQRLHYEDLSGYLLRGGSGEYWHHLCLPAIIDNSELYPEENTHGVPIDHGLADGWLWPAKHNDEHLAALKAHKRKWLAQYLQAPPRFNAEGALWNEELITDARQPVRWGPPIRTVVGVDPAVSTGEDSDLTGIVVASKYAQGRYKKRADLSGKYTPAAWANAVKRAVKRFDADAVVAEVNQGGDLVESNLRNNKYKGRVVKVHATKGKQVRAEPIVALYEQGLVAHDLDADLTELETEMLEWVPGEGPSPNRVDAAVWADTELAGGSLAALAW